MAPTLSLVRRDDQVADVDSISLLDYTDGLQLADNGWQSAIASPGDTMVSEALTLRVKGSSQDNLSAKLQALDLKLKQASWYADPQELYNVWLRAKLKNETNSRQALVLGGRRSPAPLMTNLSNVSNAVQTYALALDRMPYWESITVVDYSQAGLGTLSSLGGKWDYTTYGGSPGAVAGDVPARIAQGIITGVAGVGPMTKAWVGFRTNRFGNRANFAPVWYHYASVDALRSDTDTTKSADAQASNGSKTVTTFATVATMKQRNILRVSDFVPATPNDMRGTYMVLLRAKLSAGGSSVNVRLADGYISSQTLALRARVNITSTSYYLYELGVVQIPSPGRPVPVFDIANYALALQAERVSGAASLECDAFILIPMSEGYLTTDQPDASTAGFGDGSAAPVVAMGTTCLSGRMARCKGFIWRLTPSGNITVRYSGGLPTGSGIAVVAAQRLTSSVKPTR
jgi:hypothetical protein